MGAMGGGGGLGGAMGQSQNRSTNNRCAVVSSVTSQFRDRSSVCARAHACVVWVGVMMPKSRDSPSGNFLL